MKIAEITKLKNKAIKEAQREVDKVFSKYSKLIVEEISNQIPVGQLLRSGNGISMLEDENGAELSYGNAWSITAQTSPKMDKIADLQYSEDIQGSFLIPDIIKGRA